MARFNCVCGHVMNNQLAPNDVELHVYSDIEWDRIINMNIIDPLELPSPSVEVWKCPKCQRVYIFKNNYLIKRYVIEWETSDSD